jgi:formylglycine-generating enzyme required for sulfatase activity/dienelactone hydrolase
MVGETILHYAIDARLGEGGMGTVYRARDTVLNRVVALKVLSRAPDEESTRRLLREARAASALNHPNSVTIHAVEQHGDLAFIVMEHVAGTPLDRGIPAGGFPVDRALQYACDITDAVAAAHAQGIIHRDLKPGNVMITPEGRVKVLDFGIARRTVLPDEATRLQTVDRTIAGTGLLVGTAGYMAPEQIEGKAATERSDVFALGVIIFELLTGVAPFRRETTWAALDATMNQSPPSLSALNPGVPPELAGIVARCLRKDPADRPASARELHDALDGLRKERTAAAGGTRRGYRWVAVIAIAAIAIVGVVAFAWVRVREGRLRWARDTAIPEISRLAAAGDAIGAYRIGLRARALLPNDPQVASTWDGFTQTVTIASEPPGAGVSIRSLSGKDEGWITLGTTPVTADVPLGQMRWRFTLAGHDVLEIAPNPFPHEVALARTGTAPPAMVRVPAGTFEQERELIEVRMPEYWIDTYEVTNRQFKEFVDRGGYQNRDYWREPIVSHGRTFGLEEAFGKFRDATGRPGPATWELGEFPEGQGDWPVHGVSWYEAAAYARFAGKSLPTVYHWYRASGAFGIFSDVLRFSNFGGRGPERVGTSGSLGPFGTHDMPGNVKEWTWNQSGKAGRFILGGAWNEPPYQFHDEDATDPMERRPGFGFRCIKQSAELAADLLAPIESLTRDPSALKPVSDEIFRAYRRLYDYDPRPLDPRIDERDETNPHYIFERVSFTAPYGSERVPVMLFLPRGVRPPYQVLVYFPGSDAVRTQSSRSAYLQLLQFLPRSGRAVAFPIYQQTFERRRQSSGPNFLREISIQRGQDLRRTIDYLETRPDIDTSRSALYGLSLGAQLGPVFLAIEPRLRVGVLLSGGFETWTIPPETDPVNFAPRVTQPVLMVNGREDFDLPYETAQVPLFRMLGTKPPDKQHVVLEGGHLPPRPQEVFKEILDWLDRYLGPVER